MSSIDKVKENDELYKHLLNSDNERNSEDDEDASADESSELLDESISQSFSSHSDSREKLQRRPLHRRKSCQSTPKDTSDSQFSPKHSPVRDSTPNYSRDLSSSRSSSPFQQRSSSLLRSVSPMRATSGKHRATSLYPDLSEMKLSSQHKEHLNEYINNYKHLSLILVVLVIIFAYFLLPLLMVEKGMSEHDVMLKSAQIEEELLSLQVYFPHQSAHFWNVLRAQIKSVLLVDEPVGPATFLLVVPKGAESTSHCFLRQLVKRLDRVMQTQHNSDAFTDAREFKRKEGGVGKMEMDEKLKGYFRGGQIVSVVEHIEVLQGEDVMLFHGYCDTVNAPFKNALFLLTFHPASPIHPSNLHRSTQTQMAEVWLGELEADAFASLMTRISNSLILVQQETIIHCSSH